MDEHSAMRLLGQVDLDYFMKDPTGQKIAAGVLIGVGLLIVIVILRAIMKNKEFVRKVITVAVLLAIGTWVVSAVGGMGPTGVFLLAGIGFAVLVAMALFHDARVSGPASLCNYVGGPGKRVKHLSL